jgi:hypothetical protein
MSEYDNPTLYEVRRAILFEIAYYSWGRFIKSNHTPRADFAHRLFDALRHDPHDVVDPKMGRFVRKSGVCALIREQKRRRSGSALVNLRGRIGSDDKSPVLEEYTIVDT